MNKYFNVMIFMILFVVTAKSEEKEEDFHYEYFYPEGSEFIHQNYTFLYNNLDKEHFFKIMDEYVRNQKDTLLTYWYSNNYDASIEDGLMDGIHTTNVGSYYLKAYYWIWLVFNDESKEDNVVILKNNKNEEKYDFLPTDPWESKGGHCHIGESRKEFPFVRKFDKDIIELQESYSKWFEKVKNLGFKNIQNQKISPLPDRFSWSKLSDSVRHSLDSIERIYTGPGKIVKNIKINPNIDSFFIQQDYTFIKTLFNEKTLLRKLNIFIKTEYDTITIKSAYYCDESYDTTSEGNILYNNTVSTLQFKAYYWLWLLFSNIEANKPYYTQLKNEKDDIVYDFEIVEKNGQYIGIYNSKEMAILRKSHIDWIKKVEKYGLEYVRKKKISPLPKGYYWEAYDPYKHRINYNK